MLPPPFPFIPPTPFSSGSARGVVGQAIGGLAPVEVMGVRREEQPGLI